MAPGIGSMAQLRHGMPQVERTRPGAGASVPVDPGMAVQGLSGGPMAEAPSESRTAELIEEVCDVELPRGVRAGSTGPVHASAPAGRPGRRPPRPGRTAHGGTESPAPTQPAPLCVAGRTRRPAAAWPTTRGRPSASRRSASSTWTFSTSSSRGGFGHG